MIDSGQQKKQQEEEEEKVKEKGKEDALSGAAVGGERGTSVYEWYLNWDRTGVESDRSSPF